MSRKRERTSRTVRAGEARTPCQNLVCSGVSLAIACGLTGAIQAAIHLPAAPFYVLDEAYADVLGTTWRLFLASLAVGVPVDGPDDLVVHDLKNVGETTVRFTTVELLD